MITGIPQVKFNWKMLLSYRCPECTAELDMKIKGQMVPCSRQLSGACFFKITRERMEEIRKKILTELKR